MEYPKFLVQHPNNHPVESMVLPSYPPKFFTASEFTPEKLPKPNRNFIVFQPPWLSGASCSFSGGVVEIKFNAQYSKWGPTSCVFSPPLFVSLWVNTFERVYLWYLCLSVASTRYFKCQASNWWFKMELLLVTIMQLFGYLWFNLGRWNVICVSKPPSASVFLSFHSWRIVHLDSAMYLKYAFELCLYFDSGFADLNKKPILNTEGFPDSKGILNYQSRES